jgi:two-component system phosphate regulon response regulator PhoB
VEASGRGQRDVLVVDDEAPIRLLIRVNLEAEGARVSAAADGPSGVRLALEGTPDVILLDIQMPGPNGLEVAELLRNHPATSAIPIIFLSPRREFCQCVRDLAFSDIDAVHEPFNPVELWAFVLWVLTSARERGTSSLAELEPLWALREVATTPNDTSVDDALASWRARWR